MMAKSFSSQLRQAIERSGLSWYRISKDTGVPESALSRFMSRERGLSLGSIEAICDLIGARLVLDAKPKQGKSKTSRGG